MRQALFPLPLPRFQLLAASVVLAALTACGGGGGSDSTTTDKSFKGTVTSVSSPTSFSVDGIPVDASAANAAAQGVTTGSRVEIQGQMVNGTIQAQRVEFDDDSSTDDSKSDPSELDGRVTSYTSPTSFSVDGIPVDASAAPTTLTVGAHVEIHGTVSNGVMVASRVQIEDHSGGSSSSSGSDDDKDDHNCSSTTKSSCDDGKDDDKDDDKDDSRCTTTAATGGTKSSDCDDDKNRGKR
ncbi:DUF5666 domain-containing protein [Hydrogenophaga sp. RWCD_12]|uniref:DUF5666 domain-containing protein n=1 Tax=Hydrogenophaga sp. RWCD_12 TaxID=3391190 RepID=UPI0039849679